MIQMTSRGKYNPKDYTYSVDRLCWIHPDHIVAIFSDEADGSIVHTTSGKAIVVKDSPLHLANIMSLILINGYKAMAE